MSNNDQNEKKALLTNATELANDARERLYPRGLGGGRYQGPPTTNQGPRRPGQKMW